MFEKTIADLIRGLRSNKGQEGKYLSQCVNECKTEIKNPDVKVKANAIQKLTYLHMIGYDMTFAAFNVIECMSSPFFRIKRIGYLAASQSFNENTDVLMLATNLFKKDFTAKEYYETGLALNFLATVCTHDLARDLVSDVAIMLSSSRPYIRKKAIVALYKMILYYPEALRPAFPRLKEKLDDDFGSVQCSAVTVLCELANNNPKNYLALVPLFFKMLQTNNNWLLIKILKLFSLLTPIEPRLAKKLVEPITALLNSTSAMSVLYEAIDTVAAGMKAHTGLVKLCIEKLRLFIEDRDQNLKYLGMVMLKKFMDTHPKSVSENRDTVIECLDDEDVAVRTKALDLITGMITKKNLIDVVKNLLGRIPMAEGDYRETIVRKIIELCSMKNYVHVTDFNWYVSVLIDLTTVEGTQQGETIAAQLMDVLIRVKAVRPYAVPSMISLLFSNAFYNKYKNNTLHHVLWAAAWTTGEFAEYVDDYCSVVRELTLPRVLHLDQYTEAIFIQSAMKLYAYVAAAHAKDLVQEEGAELPAFRSRHLQSPESRRETEQAVRTHLLDALLAFKNSPLPEVQERACSFHELLSMDLALTDSSAALYREIASLFEGDLNPVAPKAQRKIPVPEGLDLDTPLYEVESESEEESDFDLEPAMSEALRSPWQSRESTAEEQAARRAAVDARHSADPFYLGGPLTSKGPEMINSPSPGSALDVDTIPVVTLLPEDLAAPGLTVGGKKKRKGRKGKKKGGGEEESPATPAFEVLTTVDAPEGYNSDSDSEKQKAGSPAVRNEREMTLADVDLTTPLGDDETLYRIHTYSEQPTIPEETVEKKKKKSKKKTAKSAEEEEQKKPKKKKVKGKKGKDAEKESVDLIDLSEESTAKKTKKSKKAKSSEGTEPKGKKPLKKRGKKASVEAVSYPLLDEQGLYVTYTPTLSKSAANTILLTFTITAPKTEDVHKFSLTLNPNSSVTVVNSPSVSVERIANSAKSELLMSLQFKDVTSPIRIPAQLSFSLAGSKRSRQAHLVLPCSLFMTEPFADPEKAKAQMIQILSSGLCPHSSHGEFNLSSLSTKAALSVLAARLHLTLVEVIPSVGAASLYGISVQNHHVAALVKAPSAASLTIDIKCSDEALAQSLLKEVPSIIS